MKSGHLLVDSKLQNEEGGPGRRPSGNLVSGACKAPKLLDLPFNVHRHGTEFVEELKKVLNSINWSVLLGGY